MFRRRGEKISWANAWRVDCQFRMTPRSSRLQALAVSLAGSGIESTRLGIAGMALAPDGTALVVCAPRSPNRYGDANRNARGDILVFDLRTIDLKRWRAVEPSRGAH